MKMTKSELFSLSDMQSQMEIRIDQLKMIKKQSASQKLELGVLENHLERAKIELVNAMFNHDNFDDLLELSGLKKIE